MENPFLDYGKIVKNERFIGREKEIKIIQNRVLNDSFGNIAIQGLPRIGKSSLAWNALMLEKEKLEEEKNIFVIRLNMGTLTDSKVFFHKLIKELHKRIKKNADLNFDDFKALYEELETAKHESEKFDLIEEYFQEFRDTQYRVIYILDEFDAVRNKFSVGDFQFLRELSYNLDTEICLVTISRRTIKELEPMEGTLSNFYQTFNDLYLGMFSQNDLDEYWNRFFYDQLKLSDDDKKEITNFSGRHPFLLDLFNFNLFNTELDDIRKSILETKKNIQLTILNNYKSIFDLLKEEGLDSKLLQVIVGPVFDITRSEVEKLERYDIIRKSHNKLFEVGNVELAGFESFSVDFDQYLRLVIRDVPIWDLWSETELMLRNIVRTWLVERYGEEWPKSFRKLKKKENLIKV